MKRILIGEYNAPVQQMMRVHYNARAAHVHVGWRNLAPRDNDFTESDEADSSVSHEEGEGDVGPRGGRRRRERRADVLKQPVVTSK